MTVNWLSTISRDQSRYAPRQCEMSLQCNGVSYWLGAYLHWVPLLLIKPDLFIYARVCTPLKTNNNKKNTPPTPLTIPTFVCVRLSLSVCLSARLPIHLIPFCAYWHTILFCPLYCYDDVDIDPAPGLWCCITSLVYFVRVSSSSPSWLWLASQMTPAFPRDHHSGGINQ